MRDYLRVDVVCGFLVSLVRYPIAFALKAPVPFAIGAALLVALDSTAGALDAMADADIAARVAAAAEGTMAETGSWFSAPVVGAAVFSGLNLLLIVLMSRLLP